MLKTVTLTAIALQVSLCAWDDHPDKDSFSPDKTIDTSGNPNDHYHHDDENRNSRDRDSRSESNRGTVPSGPDRDK